MAKPGKNKILQPLKKQAIKESDINHRQKMFTPLLFNQEPMYIAVPINRTSYHA